MTLVNRILDSEITVMLREVIGTSKEVTHQLIDYMRPKNPKPADAAEVNLQQLQTSDTEDDEPEEKRPLIYVRVLHNGKPITAVVDTGSEVNLIHKSVYNEVFDPRIYPPSKRRMVVRVADGAQSLIQGVARKVPLEINGTLTYTDIYLGMPSLPYDLLLGLPWIEDNMVCIDQRHTGMYLVFKKGRSDDGPYPEIKIRDKHVPANQQIPPRYPVKIVRQNIRVDNNHSRR
jgi:hypothetical protein